MADLLDYQEEIWEEGIDGEAVLMNFMNCLLILMLLMMKNEKSVNPKFFVSLYDNLVVSLKNVFETAL